MRRNSLQLAIIANQLAKHGNSDFIIEPPPKVEEPSIVIESDRPINEPWRKKRKYGGISQKKRRLKARKGK